MMDFAKKSVWLAMCVLLIMLPATSGARRVWYHTRLFHLHEMSQRSYANSSREMNRLAWVYVFRTKIRCDPEKLRRLVKKGANPNYETSAGSLLDLAIVEDANSCAMELLKLGATHGITSPDSAGVYAINMEVSTSTCDVALLRRLLKRGARLKETGVSPPLYLDMFQKNVRCAQFLIHRGANVNAYGRDRGATPLMVAQFHSRTASSVGKRLAMTRLLIEAGANVNEQQRMGMTALFFAVGLASRGLVPCVHCAELLLQAGANPNVVDSKGQTPLLWALDPEHGTTPEAIRVLVSGGANVNLADPKTGETPLMAAAARGNRATLDVVLDAGANRCMRDKKGRTASDYARAYHHLKVAALLACRAH